MKIQCNWRAIIAISLFFSLFFSAKYNLLWLVWICSFFFSISITVIEWGRINTIIKDNILLTITTTILSAFAFFWAKVTATHHFNSKYGILTEYLNHSITAWAGFAGTIFLVSVPCIFLATYFFFLAIKNRQLKEIVKGMELIVHCASCLLILAWLSPIYQMAEEHDKLLLLLDAYTHSDCKPPTNQLAIRKDHQNCYLILLESFPNLELQQYSSQKP